MLSRFKRIRVTIAIAVTAVNFISTASAAQSTCYGTVSNGRLEDGVKLPTEGKNFTAYSTLAAGLGRTYVHSSVAEIIVAAYAAVHNTAPEKVFVYGETGWASGGKFRPHRTHQNGLSVDFFVPVVDARGQSVPLPTSVRKEYGYAIEFDTNARYERFTIDFPALAEHLYQLDLAAKARGAGLSLVIFDPLYLPKLFATPRGEYLKTKVNFMKGKAWVRHDEHYHVDFSLPCKPKKP